MQIAPQETTPDNRQQVQQHLTFMIGGEEFAVSLLKVKEIIEWDTVTEVPKTPEWIRGVINLRGSVVPVIDLAVKFRQAECDGQATVMGIMADSVRQVIDLASHDIEPPPTFGTRVKVDYLLGMARSGKKFCLILDVEKVLSTDELLELPDTLDQAAGNQQPELELGEAPAAPETPAIPEVAEQASLE
jgi:purine-binding chemotaxis protein CheW